MRYFIRTMLILLTIRRVGSFQQHSFLRMMSAEIGLDKKIGFIGLGIMGNAMSRCLLKANVPLIVWNRSPQKCENLKHDFPELVEIADIPSDVVSKAKLSFVMLSTPEVLRQVYSGNDGILAGLSSDSNLVDCATVNPEDMHWAAAEVLKRGANFAEAPVSGSKVPAEKGQLIFMASGDEKLVTFTAAPYLSLMGKATYYLGSDIGQATKMKLVVNSIMGNMLACLTEGMHLANSSGLSEASLLEIISQGAIANPMFQLKGANMIANNHAPNFPLKHARKDIKFAADLAASLSVEALQSQAALRLYDEAVDQGLGDKDFSAIYTVKKK